MTSDFRPYRHLKGILRPALSRHPRGWGRYGLGARWLEHSPGGFWRYRGSYLRDRGDIRGLKIWRNFCPTADYGVSRNELREWPKSGVTITNFPNSFTKTVDSPTLFRRRWNLNNKLATRESRYSAEVIHTSKVTSNLTYRAIFIKWREIFNLRSQRSLLSEHPTLSSTVRIQYYACFLSLSRFKWNLRNVPLHHTEKESHWNIVENHNVIMNFRQNDMKGTNCIDVVIWLTLSRHWFHLQVKYLTKGKKSHT